MDELAQTGLDSRRHGIDHRVLEKTADEEPVGHRGQDRVVVGFHEPKRFGQTTNLTKEQRIRRGQNAAHVT